MTKDKAAASVVQKTVEEETAKVNDAMVERVSILNKICLMRKHPFLTMLLHE